MRPSSTVFIAALAISAAPAALAQTPPSPSILPLPERIAPANGPGITIGDGAQVAVPDGDKGAALAARMLTQHVKLQRGLALAVGDRAPAITFVRDAAIKGSEAYRLTVGAGGVRIAASADRGLLYGAMTLAQLMSPDAAIGRPVTIAATVIEDAPRFVWRGLMIDVVRHFQPIDFVKGIIDQMVAVKLNTLHLHLSDDQGWRVEIKRYPKLTEIGGWRTPPSTGGAPGPRHGGFYTQAELKDLVAYAAERGITIVPEIDLPGHAKALVSAYPEFGVLGDRPPVGNNWGVEPYLLNPGPAGVTFVKNVLDEIIDIFPGKFIHIGGDEAVKDQWERSPAVQAQIKQLGLKNENELQTWLIEQFGKYLDGKGRRLIGWDEILEGGIPQSSSIMSWRGEAGAIKAANSGHDVVMSPAPILYLDNLQSGLDDEPPGRGSVQSLADVYRYEPMPAGIAAERQHHVMGAQGNAWAEYLVTPYQVQHNVFPRAAAIAEFTWSPKAARDFAAFLPRVQRQGQRWRKAGVEVGDGAFAVAFAIDGKRGDALRKARVPLTLSSQTGYGTIRYTLDGSAPTARSKAYTAPLSVKPGATVRAVAFDAAGVATAATRSFDTSRAALLRRTASHMAACPNGAIGMRVPLHPDATANAPVFNVNIFDNCTLYPDAPLDIARAYRVDVARLARNYALAHDFKALRGHYNVTPHGELLVQVGCIAAAKALAAGDKNARPIIAGSFPLPDPTTAPQRYSFEGKLPKMAGDQDVCFQFTSPLSDPAYAVETVQLIETDR